jgi:outer membrane murein-binding lipoprotein Lpp
MAGKPCAETLAPLHSLMKSLQASSQILDEVPLEVMSNLQLEFTKTLRNLDDHMGNLLCLATFAQIASDQKNHRPNQHGPETPSWLLSIQQFFGAKRGPKTLDLVVLRVILACSSNCSLPPSQAAKSIRLAICVLDAVEPEQKQLWVSNNSSKIAKLCEKVAKDGLDRETQVMGVTFLLSLRPVAALPSQIRDLGLRVLVSSDSRGALGNTPPHLVSRLSESLASCDDSIVYELLRFTVDALKDDSPNRSSLANLHTATLLLSAFQSSESKPIISSILNSVSTKETIASLFGRFPVVPSLNECGGAEVCYCAYAALKNKILLSLFKIYFTAALSNNGNATDIMLMKSFVDRSAKSFADKACSFSKAGPKDFRGSMTLRSTQDFSSIQAPSRDWRSGVTEAFMQNAQVSHDAMMKKIGDICFDLESRCYDVEGPLRLVEQERDHHIAENELLRERNDSLQKQLEQSSNTVASLQRDLLHIGEAAENASCRVQELTASIESLNQDLQEQRHDFDKTLRMEQETARTKELDLIATITEKDDQFEELQSDARQLRSENEEMRQTLDTASKERKTSSEMSASLRNELAEIKSLLAENQVLCEQKENQVKRFLTDNEDLRMEVGTMKATVHMHSWLNSVIKLTNEFQVEEQLAEVERLYSALRENEEKLRLETELLTHKHEVETSQAESEVSHTSLMSGTRD